MWTYETDLQWKPGTEEARVTGGEKPALTVMPPPEFGGRETEWSPEDLLLAAIQSCMLMTLLYWVNQLKVKMLDHSGRARAVMERTKDGLRFTGVALDITVRLASESDRPKLERALARTEQACPVKNAINAPVTTRLTVHIGDPVAS